MTSAGFRLVDVSVHFGDLPALDSVDLTVEAGESVAFVGPSGAGKTTLLNVLNGTLRPSAGSVWLNGSRLDELGNSELRRVRTHIGFVHQNLSLIPNLRVIQNVVAGRLGSMGFLPSLRAMSFPSRDVTERVFAILERVGIGEKLYERTDRLSGGQRQRVAIARALFQEPSALLADEPVSSVDPARARDTVALLTDISREQGITLCMSIHNLDLAREYFPRLVGLRGGRVLFDHGSDAVDGQCFHKLFDLAPEEMLTDGA